MTNTNKKRVGRVILTMQYYVDLDDPEMIADAKDCIVEDVCHAVKFHEIDQWIDVEEAPDATEANIPEHLQPFHSEVFNDD